jgi:hypothetical protein
MGIHGSNFDKIMCTSYCLVSCGFLLHLINYGYLLYYYRSKSAIAALHELWDHTCDIHCSCLNCQLVDIQLRIWTIFSLFTFQNMHILYMYVFFSSMLFALILLISELMLRVQENCIPFGSDEIVFEGDACIGVRLYYWWDRAKVNLVGSPGTQTWPMLIATRTGPATSLEGQKH